MQYDNTNSGAIFVNDKGDNPKRPDRKGSINVEGVDYWISGWIREKEGKPYMSLKVERKENQGQAQSAKPQAATQSQPEEDDSIPF
jgi:hypothetical protein